jgi:pimeloyl-ACP methyl ester carboxylesterase
MARAREPEALAPRLAEVRCPVWLLLGAAPHEGGPTPDEISTLKRNLIAFTLSRIPSAGNFIFEEAPAAVVAAVAEAQEARGSRRADK